jgi:hypothetical protein
MFALDHGYIVVREEIDIILGNSGLFELVVMELKFSL